MSLGFHMADHGLDGGAAAQFAFDGAEHATLLPGDEDTVLHLRSTAAIFVGELDAGHFQWRKCCNYTFATKVPMERAAAAIFLSNVTSVVPMR